MALSWSLLHPHLVRVIVVSGTAHIHKGHLILRIHNLGKLKRDVVTDDLVLLLLHAYAGNPGAEEHGIVALQLLVPGFLFHEVLHQILFQLVMHMHFCNIPSRGSLSSTSPQPAPRNHRYTSRC